MNSKDGWTTRPYMVSTILNQNQHALPTPICHTELLRKAFSKLTDAMSILSHTNMVSIYIIRRTTRRAD